MENAPLSKTSGHRFSGLSLSDVCTGYDWTVRHALACVPRPGFRLDSLRSRHADGDPRGQVPSMRSAVLRQRGGILANDENVPPLRTGEVCRSEFRANLRQPWPMSVMAILRQRRHGCASLADSPLENASRDGKGGESSPQQTTAYEGEKLKVASVIGRARDYPHERCKTNTN